MKDWKEKEWNKGGLGKASFILGIIAVIFSLLPLMSGWFLLIFWLCYVIAALGIALGIWALIKKQSRSIVALVLCVLSSVIPSILSDKYEDNAVESGREAVGYVNAHTNNSSNAVDNEDNEDIDYSDNF